MESYLQDQDLWEIIRGKHVKPSTEDATLKKRNIKAKKAILAINSITEKEMLQHIYKAKMLNEAWGTFVTHGYNFWRICYC